ncbi:MAG: ABC transporter ATP-binding protein/permease [Oscillospiraceae bacterium]|jgi:ATP-binding cassette subfamily B protein|nr:ABC transporter ATP-binding protein/permease [Oscillospiraceae bacterium]
MANSFTITIQDNKDSDAKKKLTLKEKLKKQKEMFASLLFLLKLYRKYALGFLILTVVFWTLWGPVNSLLGVYVSRITIEQLVELKPYWTIVGTIALMYGLHLLLNFATSVFETVFQSPKSSQITYRVNRDIFTQALATDYKYYDSPEFYSDFTWATQNLSNQLEQSRSTLENLVQNVAQFIAMAAYITIAGPWVLVISIVGMIVTSIFNVKGNGLWIKRYTEAMKYMRRTSYVNRMFYTVDPQADLKATRARKFFFSTYDDAAAMDVKIQRKYAIRTAMFNVCGQIASRLTTIVMIALIVKKVTQGDVADIALYSSLLVASTSLSGALFGIGSAITNFNREGQYTHRIRKFFETESTIETTDGDGKTPDNGALAVDFDDVSFAYGEVDGKSVPVLTGVDMHIKKGEKVAIVGENGAGKTTLMKLLLRLYDVSDGSVRVGGVPVGEYDVRKLRDRIGVAFQSSTVYALPVADNLRVYRDADEDKLRDILKKVGLTKLLDGDGLNTSMTREFDDDGVMLSGGETQKFALARLLAGDFGVLMLDEPTASLDPIAEYELNKLILDHDRPETTIVVAHRLSTVRDADRIFLVDGGKIAEVGTHNELIALGGKYHEMFTKQAENYVKE